MKLPRILRIGRYPSYVRQAYWRAIMPISLMLCGVRAAKSARFFGIPIISKAPSSTIEIGERVIICSHSLFTDLGVNHPVILRTLRPGAYISIGADTGISGATICAARGVSIGSGCLLGANVTIADTDFHAVDVHDRRHHDGDDVVASAPIFIEDNVFVGANSIILKGVRIGANSVIGAGAVVTSSIPCDSIAAGNPARVIRALRSYSRAEQCAN